MGAVDLCFWILSTNAFGVGLPEVFELSNRLLVYQPQKVGQLAALGQLNLEKSWFICVLHLEGGIAHNQFCCPAVTFQASRMYYYIFFFHFPPSSLVWHVSTRHNLSIIPWRNSIVVFVSNENDYQVDSEFTTDNLMWQLSYTRINVKWTWKENWDASAGSIEG